MHAKRRSLFGTPSFNLPSRFIQDIPTGLISTQMSTAGAGLREVYQERNGRYSTSEPRAVVVPTQNQGSSVASSGWKPPFGMGDKVRHRTFGMGVVIACAPIKDDVEVTVAFPGATGIKKLIQKLAKLEKIA